MKKILLIEDLNGEFDTIKSFIEKNGFEVVPKDSNDSEKMTINMSEASMEVEKHFTENIDTLVGIVCDLDFNKNQGYNKFTGADIVDYIRKNDFVKNKPFFCRTIPIVILTAHHSDFMAEKQIALKQGAITVFTKDIENDDYMKLFIESLKSMIDVFSYNISINDIVTKQFESYKELLISRNELIETNIDNLKLIIQNSSNDTILRFNSSFGILLRLALEQLKQTNSNFFNNFINEFDVDLIEELGKETYDNLIAKITAIDDKHYKSFKELLSNGSVEDAVKYIGNTLAIPTGGISSLIAFSINLLIKNYK